MRARDHAGNLGSWSSPRCVAEVLDDVALTPSTSWARKSASGYIDGTYTQTTSHGAPLSLPDLTADRVAVRAMRCATCGSIAVYIGNRATGSASLQSSTTQDSHEFTFNTFPLASGRLRILVTSSNHLVRIDAVGVRRN